MLLSDVKGNNGAVDPEQIEMVLPKANTGVTIVFTVTVSVAVVAQAPLVGVKV